MTKFFIAFVSIWFAAGTLGALLDGWLFRWVYDLEPAFWRESFLATSGGAVAGLAVVGSLQTMILIVVYQFVNFHRFPEGIAKGLAYGVMVWLFTAMVMAPLVFMIEMELMVIIYWIFQALLMNLASGLILGLVYRS